MNAFWGTKPFYAVLHDLRGLGCALICLFDAAVTFSSKTTGILNGQCYFTPVQDWAFNMPMLPCAGFLTVRDAAIKWSSIPVGQCKVSAGLLPTCECEFL